MGTLNGVQESAETPRIIWMLWLQGWPSAPEPVRRCLVSWRRHNPDWELRTLSASNLEQYVPTTAISSLAALSPNHQSDMIRLHVLDRHGGVWVDATVLCREPLDHWLSPFITSGFFGFADPGPDRLLASWFLVAEPETPIIAELSRQFAQYVSSVNSFAPSRWQRSIAHRLEPIVNAKAARTAFWFSPLARRFLQHQPYYALHYLFNRVVARDPACREQWDSTPRYPADECHLLAQSGYANPLTASARAAIDRSTAPMFKLSWKHPLGLPESESMIDYAFRTEGVSPDA